MQSPCAILSSAAGLDLQYFSTLSHKEHDFRKQNLLNIKCVFRVSLLLSETFFTIGRNERDMIENIGVYWSSCKVPVIVVRF